MHSSSEVFWLAAFSLATAFCAMAEEPFDPQNIDARIALSAPTADERKLDRIGWAEDLRTAKSLAKKHERPVFLFTHDGRMGIGRC